METKHLPKAGKWKIEIGMNSHNGKKNMVRISVLLLSLSLFPSGASANGARKELLRARSHLAEQVRKELVLLPYYSVFDHMSFEIIEEEKAS
jgi:hypothetical protein